MAVAVHRSKRNADIDALLEQTLPRRASARPPIVMRRSTTAVMLKEWASSQVAAYRVGLFLGYIIMIYFGFSALVAGIPIFEFTTPEGWTPIWASAVIVGSLVAAAGSIRAGSEPVTKEVRVFNGVELFGAITLFLTLGSYATLLLIFGYALGDDNRVAVGAGFVALGIPPTIRMLWLIFRPRFLAISARETASVPMVILPHGYAVFSVDSEGRPIEPIIVSHEAKGEGA